MKKIFGLSAFIFAFLLLSPLFVLSSDLKTEEIITTVSKKITEKSSAENEITFKVLDKESGKITEYSAEDYIFGVLAAEMPALYESEALKAQAVAAYTFALNKKSQNSKLNYDISSDCTTDQAFITKDAALDKWGSNAEKYTQKLQNAVKSVRGLAITYDSKPINAVYHAISSGKTEECRDIWGKDVPYLKSVSSEGDRLCENFMTDFSLSAADLREKLSGTVNLSEDTSDWFTDIKRTKAGSVKSLKISGNEITGSKLREILNLRSSNFTVEYNDGIFLFTVYGYGHGVGMSQNGAQYMAKQGSDYKEILLHYYTDCKIEKLK